MPSLTATPISVWDDVDYGILCAAQTPATCREIADTSGLTADVVKNQIDVHARGGLLVKTVDGGVRYGLTVAGYKRMFALAGARNDSSHQAAA